MISTNEKNDSLVAILEENGVVLNDAQDALDLIATVRHYHDCDKLIAYKENICDGFFDLKTGLAGEILQKYTNYRMALAIVGDFSRIESKSLRDFIYECNNGRQIFFLGTKEEALERLHALG